MNDAGVFTFDSFLKSNPGKNLNSFDYVHAIFNINNLPIDLACCFMRLVYPEFKVVNGLAFLSEQFDFDLYKQYLSDGKDERDCQKWLNLIEVTGVFSGVEISIALELAKALAELWNLKLEKELVKGCGTSRVIFDSVMGEVFITID